MKKLIYGLFLIAMFVILSASKNSPESKFSSAQLHNNIMQKGISEANDSTKTSNQSIEKNGIGPVKEVKIDKKINRALFKTGFSIYNSKCAACHQLDNKLVGPPLRKITKKLSPVYIMNYLLNTTEMQKKDPNLKKLIKEYNGVFMPDQGLSREEARAVLEYLRAVAH